MGNAMAFLKKKGPLGMPMGFWVGFVAIGGYIGYRYWKNKSGSSSSATDSGLSGTAVTTIPGGQIDVVESSTTTAPPTKEPTLPVSTGTGKHHEHTGGKKTHHKHKHRRTKEHQVTPHDHRQGLHHTEHKGLPHRKARNHHAVKTRKRPHAREKELGLRNIRKHVAGAREPLGAIKSVQGRIFGIRRGSGSPAVTAKVHVPKHLPAPPHREHHEKKEHKAPLRKRRRVG